MGACFNSYSVEGKKTAQELRADFQRKQEEDRYENGHSYSGGFGQCPGLMVLDKKLGNTDDAYKWLADNTRKWDNAKAVQYYTYEGTARWMIGGWCAE